MVKRPKVGLALGGGGARGIAHIGVLKVLEREKIPIDLIVGNSIGALVGATYAVNPDAGVLEKRVEEVLNPKGKEKTGLKLLGRLQWNDSLKSDFFHRIVRIAQKEIFLNLATFRNALLSENDLKECVEAFLPDIDLKETTIPCAVTAVDLVSGRQVVLKDGGLIRAVMASCAVPGFMPAVFWDEMVLVDGAIVGAVPVDPAKNVGAGVVIGVGVESFLSRPYFIEDGIDTINRATAIMTYYLSKRCRENADVLIMPNVEKIAWTDFLSYKHLIRQGEKAAESKIKEIQKVLGIHLEKRCICGQKIQKK